MWFPAVRAHSGADVFTERLCAALDERGIRAAMTWLPLRAEYAPWTVPVPRPPSWANIVHINSWLPPRFVPKHLPLVVTLHSCVHDPALRPYKTKMQAAYHRHWISRIERSNIRRAQRVVAVSSYTARMAEKAFGISGIEIIYNGVDCERFVPAERKAPNQPFRLLYVGNWSRRKGVDLLGSILEGLGKGFVLHYTSDRGGQESRFSLPKNSQNLGRLTRDQLVRAYQEADALLFPSRLEGLPLVVAEAMACGLPVITTKISALSEVVADGLTGILCPIDDVHAFVKAARTLATDLQLWQQMRFHAVNRVRERFAEVIMVNAYAELYAGILRRGSA